MFQIFAYVGGLLTRIITTWQGIEIGGFRPFWYFIGIGLLTIFGFFLRGLLFGGAVGNSSGKIISKLSVSKDKNKK